MTTDDIARTGNLLGAFALIMNDKMRAATEKAIGQGGMIPAALVQIGSVPGQSINNLRRSLGLSHSATVRVVMHMEQKGWVLKSRSHEQDARMATLNLTASGQTAMSLILAERKQLLETLVKTLPQTAQLQLGCLLEHMLPQLVESLADAEQACRLCDMHVCPQDRCPAGAPGE